MKQLYLCLLFVSASPSGRLIATANLSYSSNNRFQFPPQNTNPPQPPIQYTHLACDDSRPASIIREDSVSSIRPILYGQSPSDVTLQPVPHSNHVLRRHNSQPSYASNGLPHQGLKRSGGSMSVRPTQLNHGGVEHDYMNGHLGKSPVSGYSTLQRKKKEKKSESLYSKVIPIALKSSSASKCNHQKMSSHKSSLANNHNRAASDPTDGSFLAKHNFDPQQTASPLIGSKSDRTKKPPKLSTFQSSNSKLNNLSGQSGINDSGISITDKSINKIFNPSPKTPVGVHFPVPENAAL